MRAKAPGLCHIGQKVARGGVEELIEVVDHEVDGLKDINAIGRAENVDHVEGAAVRRGVGDGPDQFRDRGGKAGAEALDLPGFARQPEFDGEPVEPDQPGVVLAISGKAGAADGLREGGEARVAEKGAWPKIS